MKQKTPYIIVCVVLVLTAAYAGYALVQYISPVVLPVQSKRYGEGGTQGWDAHANQPTAGSAANDSANGVTGAKTTGIVGTTVSIKGGAAAINRLFFAAGVVKPEETLTGVTTPVKPDPSADLQLQFILTAVFPGKAARAVLMRRGESPDGQSWLVKVGDTVVDTTIVSIGRDHIVLDASGTKVIINLE